MTADMKKVEESGKNRLHLVHFGLSISFFGAHIAFARILVPFAFLSFFFFLVVICVQRTSKSKQLKWTYMNVDFGCIYLVWSVVCSFCCCRYRSSIDMYIWYRIRIRIHIQRMSGQFVILARLRCVVQTVTPYKYLTYKMFYVRRVVKRKKNHMLWTWTCTCIDLWRMLRRAHVCKRLCAPLTKSRFGSNRQMRLILCLRHRRLRS